MGKVPEWKDPCSVDEKLIAKYQIGISESTRRRRKKLGLANLQYLRYCRLFVILATAGKHSFREIEAGAVRDIRRVPIKIWGYSVSYRPGGRTRKGERDPRWHAHVEIDRERYKELRDHFVDLAAHRKAEDLALEFYHLPFEPYAPIRRQLLNILRAVNRKRKAAGYSLLPFTVLPLRRRIVQPFGPSYREIVTEGTKLDNERSSQLTIATGEGEKPVPLVEGGNSATAQKPTGDQR
jgi:hypothetical protein